MPKTLQSHFSSSKWNWKTPSILRPWGVKLRLPRPSFTIKTLLEGWSQILSKKTWHLSLQDCFEVTSALTIEWDLDSHSPNGSIKNAGLEGIVESFGIRILFKEIPIGGPSKRWTHGRCAFRCGPVSARAFMGASVLQFGEAVGNSHPSSTLALDNGMRKKRVDFQKIPVSWCLMTSIVQKNTLPFIDEAKIGCYKFSLALAWLTSVHLRPFSHLT